jgi:dihydropteroate synthase
MVERAVEAGCARERIIVDPGLGFRKGPTINLEIVRNLDHLHVLGRPVLAGPSRKGTIGRVLGGEPEDRVEGTEALCIACIAGGVDILRIHDVRRVSQAIRMADALARQIR